MSEVIELLDSDEEDNPVIVSAEAETLHAARDIASAVPSPESLSSDEELDAACEEFLNSENISSAIRQIAEERARVNFMLATCDMPEIKFPLYTDEEQLRLQLEERLKQRKIMDAAVRSVMGDAK